jgi:hypothetical protein
MSREERKRPGSIQLCRLSYSPVLATSDHDLLPELKRHLSHKDVYFQCGSAKSKKNIFKKKIRIPEK